MADPPTPKSETRAAPRRSKPERRAEAHIHDKVERRKTKSASLADERRAVSRRQGPRRSDKNRRDK